MVSVGGARRALSRTRMTILFGCTETMVMAEFQQSVLFFSLKVPQFQFMIRVLDIPVVCRVVTLVVDIGSGTFKAGFAGRDTPCAVFPCLSAGP